MTLAALENILPNGFHDAEIGEIVVDFLSASAKLKLRVLVSLPDTEKETGVLYREITVRLRNLLGIHLCNGEPMRGFEKLEDRWMQIQGFNPKAEEIAKIPAMNGVPLESIYGFYFHGWNNCMYLAAEAAVLD
jgi:hypothetical protein